VRKTLASAKVLSSDHRFESVRRRKKPLATERGEIELRGPSGAVVGKATFAINDVKLTMEKSRAEAFAAFLKARSRADGEVFRSRGRRMNLRLMSKPWQCQGFDAVLEPAPAMMGLNSDRANNVRKRTDGKKERPQAANQPESIRFFWRRYE